MYSRELKAENIDFKVGPTQPFRRHAFINIIYFAY